MLLIFQRLWQVNWAEQWQYRANLLMYLLYWLVSPIIYLAVWTSIANSKGDVNGFTANDFITYYMTLLIVDQITSNIVIHTFAYKIQDGSLSGELIRPIHPMLTNALVNNICIQSPNHHGADPRLDRFVLSFQTRFQQRNIEWHFAGHPCHDHGIFHRLPAFRAITALAFWTTRVYSIHEFYYALILLFSGQFVPLTLMPKLIQDIAQYLPFQLLIYFPIQLILGKLSSAQIMQGYMMAGIWLVISTHPL